jgi:hypothetical protein
VEAVLRMAESANMQIAPSPNRLNPPPTDGLRLS